jgi:hypothetical protein
MTLRKELISLSHACGELHPSLVSLDRFEIVDGFAIKCARDVFEYAPTWGHPKSDEQHEIRALMKKGFAPSP